ncbi:hypothetical protein SGLAM104S_08038 [Streptomyces glaucescens]
MLPSRTLPKLVPSALLVPSAPRPDAQVGPGGLGRRRGGRRRGWVGVGLVGVGVGVGVCGEQLPSDTRCPPLLAPAVWLTTPARSTRASRWVTHRLTRLRSSTTPAVDVAARPPGPRAETGHQAGAGGRASTGGVQVTPRVLRWSAQGILGMTVCGETRLKSPAGRHRGFAVPCCPAPGCGIAAPVGTTASTVPTDGMGATDVPLDRLLGQHRAGSARSCSSRSTPSSTRVCTPVWAWRRPTATASASAGTRRTRPHQPCCGTSARLGTTATCRKWLTTFARVCSSGTSGPRPGRLCSRAIAIPSEAVAGCGCTTG